MARISPWFLVIPLVCIGLAGCGKKGGSPATVTVSKVENGKVAVKFANDSDKEVTGGYLRFYCYGADGQQSGVESMNVGFSLKAGASKDDSIPIRCAPGAASVEAEWYYIDFADKTKWENPTQPPEKRDKGGKK